MTDKRKSILKEGKQVHFWISKETADRLDNIIKTFPYSINISSIGERALDLALTELENILKNIKPD